MNFLFLAFFSMITYGLADFFTKRAMNSGANGFILVFYVWLLVTVLTGLYCLQQGIPFIPPKHLFLNFILIGLLVFCGAVSMVWALKSGPASIVFPIVRVGLVVTVLCAVVFLKERMTMNRIIGIALALASIAFLTRR